MQQIARFFLSLSLVLVGAAPAAAGTLTVDFDLGSSILQVGPQLVLVDRDGFREPSVEGSLRLTLTDVDARGVALRPAAEGQISNLELVFDLTPAGAPGLIRITQADPSPLLPLLPLGPFFPLDGRTGAFSAGFLRLRIGGGIPCPPSVSPSACSAATPPLPITFDTVLTDGRPVPFAIDLSNPDGAFFLIQLRGMQGIQPLELTLVGQESGRSFVPEPTVAHTLLIGLLGLTLLWVVRRGQTPRAVDRSV